MEAEWKQSARTTRIMKTNNKNIHYNESMYKDAKQMKFDAQKKKPRQPTNKRVE